MVGVADNLKGQVAMAFVIAKDASALADDAARLKLEGEIMKVVDGQLGAVARPARVRFVVGAAEDALGQAAAPRAAGGGRAPRPGRPDDHRGPERAAAGQGPGGAEVAAPSPFRGCGIPPPEGWAARRLGPTLGSIHFRKLPWSPRLPTRRHFIAALAALPAWSLPAQSPCGAGRAAGAERAGGHRPDRLPGQREVRRRACAVGRPRAAFSQRAGRSPRPRPSSSACRPCRWTASCGWAAAASRRCRVWCGARLPMPRPGGQLRYLVFELPGASGSFAERAQRIDELVQHSRLAATAGRGAGSGWPRRRPCSGAWTR